LDIKGVLIVREAKKKASEEIVSQCRKEKEK